MSRRYALTDLVRVIPRASRPGTLLALIELGSPRDRAVAAGLLADLALCELVEARPGEKPQQAAAAACLTGWTSLPGEIRRALRASDIDWLSTAKIAADDPDPHRRSRIASACTGLPMACGILAALLTDTDKSVSVAAGSAMLSIARHASETRDQQLYRQILPVLVDAIETFEKHRQRPVIEAIWWVLESPARAMRLGRHALQVCEWIRTSKSPSRSAARAVLRTAPEAWVRLRAFCWLTEPSIKAAAVDRLARAETAEEHDLVLSASHLLLRPSRAQAIKVLHIQRKPMQTAAGTAHRFETGGAVPPRDICNGLTHAAIRGLPGWLSRLNLTVEDLASALEPMLICTDHWARWAAARALHPSQVSDYIHDQEPLVARHAAWKWSAAGVGVNAAASGDNARAKAAARLLRSTNPQVRAAAADQAARFDPIGWNTPIARVAARRWLVRDRLTLVTALEQGLRDDDPERQLATVLAIEALGLGRELVQPLHQRIIERRSFDPVASSAARSLARWADQATILPGIQSALAHPDARVRANALDGLTRWHPGLAEKHARALLDEAEHRPRAAAVRAILSEPREAILGRSALLAMLKDERIMHRVSGCWAASRARVPDAAALLRDLASKDAEPGVRLRAAWSLRRLAVGQVDRRTLE